jgi:hypothetical protein
MLGVLISLSLAPPLLAASRVAAANVDVLNSSKCDPATQACTPCNNPNVTEKPGYCKDSNISGDNPIIGPHGVMTTVVKILSFIAGLLAVIMIIVGGVRYIVSAGNPQSISSAQKTVIYAVIGLVLAFVAQGLVVFVLSRVKG